MGALPLVVHVVTGLVASALQVFFVSVALMRANISWYALSGGNVSNQTFFAVAARFAVFYVAWFVVRLPAITGFGATAFLVFFIVVAVVRTLMFWYALVGSNIPDQPSSAEATGNTVVFVALSMFILEVVASFVASAFQVLFISIAYTWTNLLWNAVA